MPPTERYGLGRINSDSFISRSAMPAEIRGFVKRFFTTLNHGHLGSDQRSDDTGPVQGDSRHAHADIVMQVQNPMEHAAGACSRHKAAHTDHVMLAVLVCRFQGFGARSCVFIHERQRGRDR